MRDKKLYKKLLDAVRRRDIERVRDILLKNTDLFNPPYNRDINLLAQLLRTLITDCMNLEILELLVSSKKFIRSKEQLERALYRGNVPLIELLLKNGVELGTLDKEKILSILKSSFKYRDSRKVMLQYLLKNDILDIELKNDSNLNLLCLFIEWINYDSNDEVDFAEYLISLGVSIHEEDNNGETPLFYAIKKKKNKLVLFLIEKGSDINKASNNGLYCPMIRAIESGNQDAVELLLLKGIDVNTIYHLGCTALHIACLNFVHQIIILLVQKGADISKIDIFGRTPFSCIGQRFLEDQYYQDGIDNMTKEFSKLKFENILVSESFINQIDQYLVSRQDIEAYVNELAQMSSTKFHGSLTYYSLLKKSTSMKKLSFYTKNEGIVLKFETDLIKFPYYKEELRKIWEEAIRIKEKFEALIDRLKYIFGNFFPEIVTRILAENLNLNDLPLE